MNDLSDLPTHRIEKKLFKTYVIDENDKIIEEWFFWKDIKDCINSKLTSFRMKAQCEIAFYLLRGIVDPCPHCGKLIKIGYWKKYD